MKKIIKYGLIATVSLALLLLTALISLATLVDPNQFKPHIEQLVYKQTGRVLKLNGTMKWNIYPNLGVHLSDVTLSNPQNFAAGNFMAFNSADVSLALIPLLSNHIVFKTLDIDGLNLQLLQTHGKNNWTFAQSTPASQPPANAANEAKFSIRVELKNFSFTHATINYVNEDSNKRYMLHDTKLLLDSGFMGGIDVYQDNEHATLAIKKVTLNYNDKLLADVDLDMLVAQTIKYNGSINLRKLELSGILSELGIMSKAGMPPFANKITAKAENFTGNENSVLLPRLNLAFADSNLVLDVNQLKVVNFKAPQVTGMVNVAQFSLNKFMQQNGYTPPQLANTKWLDSVSFSSNFVATSNSLTLPAIKLGISDTNISGRLAFNSFKPLRLENNLTLDNLDMANLADLNGLKFIQRQINLVGNANFSTLALGGLSGRQNLTVGNITLKGISVTDMIHKFDAVLRHVGASNGDVGKMLTSAPEIIAAVNKIQHEVMSALAKGNKDYNKTTDLGRLELNANINKGVVAPSNFKLDGQILSVNGAGSMNLVNKSVAYKANAKITMAGINPLFSQLTLPMTVSGTTSDPSLSFDWLSIQNQVLKYLLNQNKGKVEKVIKDNINQAVGEQIRKNIGNSNANKAVEEVSKNVTNAIGNLFGGSK